MAEVTLIADRSGELRLTAGEKEERYRAVLERIEATIGPEEDLLASMTSIVCLLHNALPYFYWTGFYRRVGPRELLVGPYQGTLGCLSISFDRGVCGAAARGGRTVVVPDVEAFPGHVACDAASRSEIALPVFDERDRLVAVLDVDSTLPAAFDGVDARWLERIVALLRGKRPLPLVWSDGEHREGA
jgi:L-methionine (R)-S-oxide reductase